MKKETYPNVLSFMLPFLQMNNILCFRLKDLFSIWKVGISGELLHKKVSTPQMENHLNFENFLFILFHDYTNT